MNWSMEKLARNLEHCPTCGRKNLNFKKPKLKAVRSNIPGTTSGRSYPLPAKQMSKSDLNAMLAEAVRNTK